MLYSTTSTRYQYATRSPFQQFPLSNRWIASNRQANPEPGLHQKLKTTRIKPKSKPSAPHFFPIATSPAHHPRNRNRVMLKERRSNQLTAVANQQELDEVIVIGTSPSWRCCHEISAQTVPTRIRSCI